MCYSAQIEADYRRYVRMFGATMGLQEFHRLFWQRANETAAIEIPKAVEAAFEHPTDALGAEIKTLIDQHRAAERRKFEQLLFSQKTRLVEAERKLHAKPTKAAEDSRRIASKKIDWATGKLADLGRTALQPLDSRIFPQHYAPVLVVEGGQLKVLPMRYQCRPAGKPPLHDRQYPGTYNARLDNLQGFWKDLFGFQHGIVIASAFYEHVKRHRTEGRALAPGEVEEDLVLEFRPDSGEEMLLACLWSRWSSPGAPDLLSFAAITDEPPAEIAAVGHDRCTVSIKPANVLAWLQPDPKRLAEQYAILQDRQALHYDHQLAA